MRQLEDSRLLVTASVKHLQGVDSTEYGYYRSFDILEAFEAGADYQLRISEANYRKNQADFIKENADNGNVNQ